MDGIHDLGGKQGFGHVETNESGPALPEHWQGFVFALVQQLYRLQVSENVDHFRHSVERISPAAYLSGESDQHSPKSVSDIAAVQV